MAFIFPGWTCDAVMAGYQKPSSGTFVDDRDPASREESMAQDSGIGFDGQGMRAKTLLSVLTVLQGLCYKIGDSSFLEAIVFL